MPHWIDRRCGCFVAIAVGSLLPLSGATSCAQVSIAVERVLPGGAAAIARTVSIHRDEWGVPHVYGPTDASVVFGMAYAQAEDNFWQVEEGVIQSLGRAAEVYGEAALPSDLVRAALEVERLAREEYAREPRQRRRIWDAFSQGLNYYLARHPEVRPRLIRQFEPWHAFARVRSAGPGTVVDGVRLGVTAADRVHEDGAGDWQAVGTWDHDTASALVADQRSELSSMWAVAPTRTTRGHALLFQNPHVRFLASDQGYEVHLQSGEGWHISGFVVLGTPVPIAGHNEELGWSHTNGGADISDAFELRFDHPNDPLAYRHGGAWRRATEWEQTLRVRTASRVETRRFRFRRTHHGPVVARREGRSVAIRMVRFEEGGSLQQWYAMGKARSLDEFRRALGQRALPFSTMYADRRGNMLYVDGSAVPRRSPAFEWTRPLDGNDPRAEWQGYHALEELPQMLNPASGWIQSTSSTAFGATAAGHNLRREDYPTYMAPAADHDRAAMARRILGARDDWTLDEWSRAAFNTFVLEADEYIPDLIDEWERLGARDPTRAARLDSTVDALREWDRVSTTGSVPMTLFVLWLEHMRRTAKEHTGLARVTALEEVVRRLERGWGTWQVSWGEVNRLQRIQPNGEEPFDDDKPSIPVAGAPDWTATMFRFTAHVGPDGKRRYGTGGQTWASVVEFGPRVHARSVVTFGQSGNPASAHYFDQAPLYAEGRFKDAWFWREDVERSARRSYRPGSPDRVRTGAGSR